MCRTQALHLTTFSMSAFIRVCMYDCCLMNVDYYLSSCPIFCLANDQVGTVIQTDTFHLSSVRAECHHLDDTNIKLSGRTHLYFVINFPSFFSCNLEIVVSTLRSHFQFNSYYMLDHPTYEHRSNQYRYGCRRHIATSTRVTNEPEKKHKILSLYTSVHHRMKQGIGHHCKNYVHMQTKSTLKKAILL
jgi:hypothetical protein